MSEDLDKRLEKQPVELHVFKRCDFGILSKLVFNRTVANYSPYLYELTLNNAVEIVFVLFVNSGKVLRVFRNANKTLDSKWVSKVPELFEVSRSFELEFKRKQIEREESRRYIGGYNPTPIIEKIQDEIGNIYFNFEVN